MKSNTTNITIDIDTQTYQIKILYIKKSPLKISTHTYYVNLC